MVYQASPAQITSNATTQRKSNLPRRLRFRPVSSGGRSATSAVAGRACLSAWPSPASFTVRVTYGLSSSIVVGHWPEPFLPLLPLLIIAFPLLLFGRKTSDRRVVRSILLTHRHRQSLLLAENRRRKSDGEIDRGFGGNNIVRSG